MKMRLILILLTPLILMTFFQNCMKKPSGELSSYDACVSNGGGDSCGLVAANGVKLPLDPVRTEIQLNSLYQGAAAYSINVNTNQVVNGSSRSCTLNNNANWQIIKDLYSKNGICEYRFELPPGAVRCMAYAMPFGGVHNLDTNESINLSTSICQQDHFTVCGQANQQDFHQAFDRLEAQLTSNSGCD